MTQQSRSFVPLGEDVEWIVYVFPTPSNNKHVIQFRNRELFASIDGLDETQKFTVVFSQGSELVEPPPRGLMGKPATDAVKERVKKWIDPEASNIMPFSRGDTMSALKQAMLYKPDVIYLWGEKMTDLPAGEEEQAKLLEEIDRLNTSGAVINTIQWSYAPEAEQQREPSTPELIAEHTGGMHRFFSNDDLMGR